MSCCCSNQDEMFLAEAVVEYRNPENHAQVYRQEKVIRIIKTYHSCGVESVLMHHLKRNCPEGQEVVLLSISVSETLE